LVDFFEDFCKMPGWTFITNYGLVLSYIAKHQRSTAREVALAVGITERTTHKIIAELEREGYIKRKRVGRNNVYRINPHLSLRHESARDVEVGDLLKVLGWKQRRKPSSVAKP
jgi:DNA-binding IscR family transcriptional regulator